MLAPSGFLDRLGTDHVFFTLPTAVEAYLHWYVARHGSAPRCRRTAVADDHACFEQRARRKEIREEP